MAAFSGCATPAVGAAAGTCDVATCESGAELGAAAAAAVGGAAGARVGGAAVVGASPAGVGWLPQAARSAKASSAQQRGMIRLNIQVPFRPIAGSISARQFPATILMNKPTESLSHMDVSRVSIVCTVRDEADNIAALLDSMLA